MLSGKSCCCPHTELLPFYHSLASIWLCPKESQGVASFSSGDHHFVKQEFELIGTPRDFMHLGFILIHTKKFDELWVTH